MQKIESSEKKNCTDSCGCSVTQNPKTPANDKIPEKTLEKKAELDPTRFGDWEVNGRAIDF